MTESTFLSEQTKFYVQFGCTVDGQTAWSNCGTSDTIEGAETIRSNLENAHPNAELRIIYTISQTYVLWEKGKMGYAGTCSNG